ncbi:MAG: hypothetical protein H7Y61_18640 [Rhizobiales bacterium]|nr:hypothetical protein [Rhizobacter sp.]
MPEKTYAWSSSSPDCASVAGVEVDVIRGWLGHVSLETAHLYAEITLRMKQEVCASLWPPRC